MPSAGPPSFLVRSTTWYLPRQTAKVSLRGWDFEFGERQAFPWDVRVRVVVLVVVEDLRITLGDLFADEEEGVGRVLGMP